MNAPYLRKSTATALERKEVTMSSAREEPGILTCLDGAVLYVRLSRPAVG